MIAVVLVLLAATAEKDLVVNGTFEQGTEGKPEAWQAPDGLCTFWATDSQRKGKCLKIDTDVRREEFLARQKEMEKKPVPPAKPKSPTKEPKYDTVAGVEGVSYMSDFIEIAPGQDYRLHIDCRVDGGAKTPKVFVKGYFLDPRRPPEFQRRVKYEKYLNCAANEKWQSFSMACSPTGKTPDVKWVRVIIFAYWPPGTYYFDNVRLVPAPKGAPAPARTWWDADYSYRREVKIGGKGEGYAAIKFATLGKALPDCADLRLVAEDKYLVGFVRVDAGRDDAVCITCPIKNPHLTYRLYFGNPRATALSSSYFRQARLTGDGVRALPKAGLMYEVRALGEGEVDTLEHMRSLIAQSEKVYGRELGHGCTLARNPFDAREDYLVLWRGTLAIPRAGGWRFATNSNGPSFVLVNGKEVTAWPGWHDAGGGEAATHAGEVVLAAGTHTFEYLYASRGGLHGHVCGIQGPEDEKVRPLGAKDFVPFLPATVGRLEDLHSPDVCDFSWETRGGWGRYGDCVLVRFSDVSTLGGAEPVSRRWSFGDGQTAEGKSVDHLFLECGVFDVGLELTSAAGAVVGIRARVAVDPRDRGALDVAALTAASLGYECARLSDGALRNLVLLRWEDAEARGFSEAAKSFFGRAPELSSEALVRCADALLDEVFFSDAAGTVALAEYLLGAAPGIELRTKAAAAAADTRWHLQGDRDGAERLLRRAIELRIDGAPAVGPFARLLLGELLDAKGVKDEAAASIAAVTGGGVTEYMRGECIFKIGVHVQKKEFGRAWEALNEWLVLDPSMACGESSLYRAQILVAAGVRRPALDELERFLPRAQGALRKETLVRAEAVAAELGLREKSAAFAQQRAQEFPAGDGKEEPAKT